MDESWRMRIGPTPTTTKLPNCPPRRSTEDSAAAAASLQRKNMSGDDSLNPEDFTDVFGGPPLSVLSRQFTTNLPRSSTGFYCDDIFRQPYKAAPLLGGRITSLPNRRNYQINEFYSDIYGWDDERVARSRSRSKASSSSALSSEELSPLRPAISDDGYDEFSLFGAKLRPINVKPRWNPRRMEHEDLQKHQNLPPPSSDNNPIHINPKNIDLLESLKNHPFGLSRRKLSLESNLSFIVPAEDLHVNSPSSAVSSVCNSDKDSKADDEILEQEEDIESMNSSYVIEINGSDNRCDPNGVDEAIAWAKEKYGRPCLDEKLTETAIDHGNQLLEGDYKDGFQSLDEQREEYAEDETSKIEAEMQVLDEKIRLWSTGKEADIRLLLSSLHHILWPNSGWLTIPLMNLIENSEVKKAYQKAQLCLHPDKLQQRGATITEKYVAKKVFSALQDAWDAFITRDVFSR